MNEIPTPENWWVALILFLLFGSPALFSKAATKLPGALGAGARWFQNRAAVKASNVVTTSTQRLEIMIDEKVEAATEKLNERLDELTSYLAYDADWHRDKRVYMAEQGIELPPPPHLTLSQWRDMRETERAEVVDGIRDYHSMGGQS